MCLSLIFQALLTIDGFHDLLLLTNVQVDEIIKGVRLLVNSSTEKAQLLLELYTVLSQGWYLFVDNVCYLIILPSPRTRSRKGARNCECHDDGKHPG